MTFVRANPPGWALFELLTSAQMNIIDSQIPFALDGQAGGSYTPTASIELDGGSIPNPDFLLDLTAGPGGAIHIDAADPAADVSGVHIECTDNTEGMRVEAVGDRNQGLNPQTMMTIIGHTNIGGGGGIGATILGGHGSTFGAPGATIVGGQGGTGSGADGLSAFGGDATQNGQSGGTGIYGEGGEPRGGGDPTNGAAAGIHGVGGSTGTGDPAGHGVVGIGGSSGTPALSGSGGYFEGSDSSPGVLGVAEIGNAANGVEGRSDAYGVFGQGVSGGRGGGFVGEGGAAGLLAGVSGSSSVAIECAGAIDFELASSGDLNPPATDAQLNRLFGKNTIKAWGLVEDGVLVEGFNIASVAVDGTDPSYLLVTFAEDMANADYIMLTSPTTGFAGNNPRWQSFVWAAPGGAPAAAPTVSAFQVRQIGNDGTVPFGALSQNVSNFHFAILAEQ